jgi:hypothetical protein
MLTSKPEGKDYWKVTYRIKFRSEATSSPCWIAIPTESPAVRVLRESYSHSQLEMMFRQDQESLERDVLLIPTARSALVHFEAQVDLLLKDESIFPAIPKEDLTTETRLHYLRDQEGIPSRHPFVSKTFKTLMAEDEDKSDIIERIYSICSDLRPAKDGLKKYPIPKPYQEIERIARDSRSTNLGRALFMVALCRSGQIPSRLVSGFLFSNVKTSNPHYWVEVYENGRWASYDPAFGNTNEFRRRYLPLRRDKAEIIDLSDARSPRVEMEVQHKVGPPGMDAFSHDSPVFILDFTRLPPKLADALSLILLLPLGGLITSIGKHLFKLEPFGYFTTALIALSFVDLHWLTGLNIFVMITAIGLTGRIIINRLNLHKLPRLTIVLLFVVLGLSVTVALLDFLDMKPGSRGVLLPMISLTIMIERFHVTIEDKGYGHALKRMGSTLLFAFICLLIFRIEIIRMTLLTFPEAEFFIAAGLVWIGRYKREDPMAVEQGPTSESPDTTKEEGMTHSESPA